MSRKKNKIQKTYYSKAEGENRTINLQFRVTEEELKKIEKRQAEVGILNRSSFLRKMALNGICIRVEAQYLREASQLLWRTSNNMNQYAKKANATGSIYLEDINSMKVKYDELIQVYGNILQQFNEKLQKQFISTFMCVASFAKNCSEGLGKFPNKRHLYYRCTAC